MPFQYLPMFVAMRESFTVSAMIPSGERNRIARGIRTPVYGKADFFNPGG